jgi:hypothetical protein
VKIVMRGLEQGRSCRPIESSCSFVSARSAHPTTTHVSWLPGVSEKGECTKSLRSSPLRGGKSRESGSQLTRKRWRV